MTLGARYRERNSRSSLGEVIGVFTQYNSNGTLFQPPELVTRGPSMVSELNEWCVDEVHRPPYHSGGPLYLAKTERSLGETFVSLRGSLPGGYNTYQGSVMIQFVGRHTPLVTEKPDENFGSVSSYGAEAWAKFKPGKPALSFGVSLGELKDMPRQVLQLKEQVRLMRKIRGKRSLKKFKLSDAYLSYEFGWKPVVQDLINVFKACSDWEAKLTRMQQESGKWLTRGGSVENTSVQSVDEGSDIGAIQPSMSYPYIGAAHSYTSTSSYVQKIWFKGKFRYYVPPVPKHGYSWRKFNQLRRLYGVEVTPDLVWNLTPWSWLVDWFSNAGYVVSNLADGAVDDVVAAYAYIMGTTYGEVAQTTIANLKVNNEVVQVPMSGISRTSIKRREGANPFGFSIGASDISLRQAAILSAIGFRL